MHAPEPLTQATSKKYALSTIELTQRKTDRKSDKEAHSLAHSDNLFYLLSSFTHENDATYYSPKISIDLGASSFENFF